MRTMHLFSRSLLLGALLGATCLCAQNPALDRMRQHIRVLSDDSLEGREAGTAAERKAAAYLEAQMRASGLRPGFGDGYLQPFEFFNRREVKEDTYLKIADKTYEENVDFLVLAESRSVDFGADLVSVGFGIDGNGRDDYKGKDVENKFAVIERGSPAPDNPHAGFEDYISLSAKLEAAKKHGAIGVIFVDPSGQTLDPVIPNYSRKSGAQDLVAVYFPGMKASQLNGKWLLGDVILEDDYRTGHNVLGLIDNKAAYTVVIGAHFDHLGYGDEGSLHRGDPAIHNGADDNASGTALMLELGKALQAPQYAKYNYLMMGFSGEEKGLLGSNFYTKNPSLALDKVAFMINFDMVGRLNPENNTCGINGVGTSPAWNAALDKITIPDFKIKTSESGVGPSDQTSFYLKDIPAIHYFSGTHGDYHKPSDDESLINYDGVDKIYRHVSALIAELAASGDKIAFTSTKQDENGDVPRWKVTLGVVPDYMFDGKGMRIDGVTDGKPASKAGLQTGDVVVEMAGMGVTDMMSYMRALSKFDKGQTVKVVVLRNGKKKAKKVTF
jgi:aminopeptidase YwaD